MLVLVTEITAFPGNSLFQHIGAKCKLKYYFHLSWENHLADLFNIYSEMILRNLENYPGVKINGENINNIRYADDTVLIADSEENVQRLLDITIEKSEEMGLTLNVKKTECMVISKKAIVPSCNLQSRGQQIKLVKKFKYLGYNYDYFRW